MSHLDALTDHPSVLRWGWVLVHFLWQGAALSVVAWLLLACTAGRAARLRYQLAMGCLFFAAAMPVMTWISLDPAVESRSASVMPARGDRDRSEHPVRAVGGSHTVDSGVAAASDAAVVTLGEPGPMVVMVRDPDAVSHASRGEARPLASVLEPALPWCVLAWGIGVLILSLRLIGASYVAGRLVASADPLRQDCVGRMQQFVSRLAIPQTVRWLESARVRVPQAIGWYKPVVLVPTSLFTTLTPAEIESLLLHELVHLRRYDFLLNLLQCAIETLLFFHPGIHWLSRRVRLERELACDEEVIRLTGDRFTFSRALLSMADQPRLPHPALAAADGELTVRIHAVLGMKRSGSVRGMVAFAVPAVCLIAFALILIGRQDSRRNGAPGETNSTSGSAVVERFLSDGLPVPDLAGRVIDASGAPVAGVTVYLRQSARSAHGDTGSPVNWLDLARTNTEQQGRFAFTDVLDHKDGRVNPAYDVVAFKTGFAISWKHVRPKQAVSDIKLTLKAPAAVSGLVRAVSGQPLPGARVTLKHLMSIRHITQADLEEGRWPSWGDARFASFHGFRKAPETTTDESGRFELAGLVPGSGVFLEVAHPEHLVQNVFAATVDELGAEDAAKAKRDVQTGELSVELEPGYRIRAVVRDAESGELIPNVRYATTHQSYRLPPENVASDGIVEVNHLPSPRFWLIVFPPEGTQWLAYHHLVAWPEDERLKQVEVNLRKGITVRGRVISGETGEGVAGVDVVASSARAAPFEENVPRQYAAAPVTTGSDGSFTLACPTGEHRFEARGRIKGFLNLHGVATARQTVSVTDDGPQGVPEIALSPAPRFRLVVTDWEGNPAANVAVRARAHHSLNSSHAIEGLTDENGEYLLDELYMSSSPVQELMEEEVILRDSTGEFGARLLLNRPGEADPIEQRIEVPLQRLGTVVGRTVDADSGRPVAGTSVTLYKRNHVPNGLSSTGSHTVSGDDGMFALDGVFPGVDHSLSMSHTRFEAPNGIHLHFEINDREPYDFGDIKLRSLTPPAVAELAPVQVPDVSELAPQQAFELLDAEYKTAFQAYRDTFEELNQTFSVDDIVARREPTPVYCEAMLKLAEADPESEQALKTCVWIVASRQIAGSQKRIRETRDAATKILQQNFLDREEMADCIYLAINALMPPDTPAWTFERPELLAAATEKLLQVNRHRGVHARACFYVAERLMQHLTGRGFAYVSTSQDTIDLCRKYLERLQDDYPEYDHFIYGTYGEAAKRYLFDLDHMLVGKTPPDLIGTDVTGREVKLSDYRGKVVIVDFWQARFEPATADHHGLGRILEKLGDQVAVLSVVSSPPAEVLQAVEQHGIDYPVFADGDDGPLFTLWNIHTWPTTFVLDENGVILHRGQRGTTLENTLVEHLAGRGAEPQPRAGL